MNRHAFEKYLRKNPAPKVDAAAFSGAVILPVCEEEAEFPATLQSLLNARGSRSIALVAVFNHPAGNGKAEAANQRLMRECKSLAVPGLFLLDAGALDCGVGEARKRGLDGVLQSLPFDRLQDFLLFSCDADAPVSPDYFAVLEAEFRQHPETAGLVPMLRHRRAADPERERAIRAYEQYCFDFQQGLASAGSPYAYLTFGSALACRAESYAACGGMRVRRTGEDFYFLEALAKSSRFQVRQLPETLVFPSPRLSCRVPVGTGTRIAELLRGKALPVYPPAAWAALKRLLKTAEEARLANPAAFLASLDAASRDFLEARHFSAEWPKILANTPPGQLRNAFFCWFDSLRTLQFLKSLTFFSR